MCSCCILWILVSVEPLLQCWTRLNKGDDGGFGGNNLMRHCRQEKKQPNLIQPIYTFIVHEKQIGMEEDGSLENTIVLMMADHGLHMGINFMFTPNGRIEHM